LPKNKLDHIAAILDGNKRWGKKNNLSIKESYKAGLGNIDNLINNCIEYKIKYLTLFTLSSENINRKSVNNIYQVVYDDFAYFFENIVKQKKTKIKVFGSKNYIPKKIIDLILYCEENTKYNEELFLNIAFNYGFRNEIKFILENLSKKNNLDFDNELSIKNLFYLGSIPDPDILIRTGGEKRLSNFIMYNLIYTEIFFVDTLWPDFNKKELIKIINDYKKINRRYGL